MADRIEDYTPRTCLTCRHLVIGGEGRLVEGMPETDFQQFSCKLLGQQIREYFAAPLPKSEFSKPRPECPHWHER